MPGAAAGGDEPRSSCQRGKRVAAGDRFVEGALLQRPRQLAGERLPLRRRRCADVLEQHDPVKSLPWTERSVVASSARLFRGTDPDDRHVEAPRAARASASASAAAESARSASIPRAPRYAAAMAADLASRGSAISTRRSGARLAGAPARTAGSVSENENVEPPPGVARPPRARRPSGRTSRWQIASPRPVPPGGADRSSCTNGSNSRSRPDAGMPSPVSLTAKRTVARPLALVLRASARIATSPRSVNFTALPARLTSTCRSHWRVATQPRRDQRVDVHASARAPCAGRRTAPRRRRPRPRP